MCVCVCDMLIGNYIRALREDKGDKRQISSTLKCVWPGQYIFFFFLMTMTGERNKWPISPFQL